MEHGDAIRRIAGLHHNFEHARIRCRHARVQLFQIVWRTLEIVLRTDYSLGSYLILPLGIDEQCEFNVGEISLKAFVVLPKLADTASRTSIARQG